jgi:hypothetical protein
MNGGGGGRKKGEGEGQMERESEKCIGKRSSTVSITVFSSMYRV